MRTSQPLLNRFLMRFHDFLNKLLVKSGYVSISLKESKRILIKSLVSIVIAITLLVLKPVSNNIFLYLAVALLTIYSLYPFILILNDYLKRAACLYEDLRFLLISSSLTAPSFDLIKLMMSSIFWKNVFNCIVIEAARLRAFTKWLTTHDALILITDFSPSKKFKKVILEYIESLRRGTLTLRLRELSKDIIKELMNESRLFLNKSVSIIALSTIILGFISAIVFALEIFLGYNIMNMYLMFSIFSTLFLLMIFPERPYILKISMSLSKEKIKVISYILMLTVIVTEVFLILFKLYGNVKLLLLSLTLFLMPLAVVRLYPFITGLRELKEVPSLILSVAEALQSSTDIVNDLRNVFIKSKVSTVRSLSTFVDLNDLVNRISGLRSWIARYTVLNIYLILSTGKLERNLLIELKDVISEFISMSKEFLVSVILPISLSVFLPWFIINMLRLSGIAVSLNFIIFAVLQSFLYSLVTSKYIFDDLSNPTLFILSLTTLYTLL